MIRGRVRGPNNLPSMKRCGFTTWVESKHWMAAAIVLCWRCTAQRRRFVRACHNGFHLRNRKGGNPETSEVSWSPPKTFEKKNSSFQRKGCKTTVPYVCVCVIFILKWCVSDSWFAQKKQREQQDHECDEGEWCKGPIFEGGLCRCFRKFGQPVEIGSFSWLRLVL